MTPPLPIPPFDHSQTPPFLTLQYFIQARFSLLIFLFKLFVSDNACGTNTNQCFHPPLFFNEYFLSLPSLPGVSSNGPSITVFPLSSNIFFFAVKSITVTLFIELWLL